MVEILFRIPLTDAVRQVLESRHALHEVTETGPATLAARCGGARVLVTNGTIGASRAEMEALPELAMICCLGTGYENVDIEAARARGIIVTHGAGSNAAAVADHAMALLLAAMRDLPWLDREARQGLWRDNVGVRPIPTGKRLGLLGLGAVGEKIARRAAGFDMTIAYHTRRPRPEVPWRHVGSLPVLAEQSDCLIVAVPGGPATFHMVDAAVLQALGPQGFLVNVGRGSVVDSAALATALQEGTIAGAALDVFEGEPEIPPALLAAPRLVITPHVAAWAPEVRTASAELLRQNIEALLAGMPPVSPVPEMRGAAVAA
ncbi:NAD(P)-dependent oxidoreductase [Roseomonas sp. E05]|uniref:NAD(P)-dependent oxidoreductase n=1 Tax=Roseomonas sp. E05 TaxID=3046310 RepID=UPI0024BA6851|nr:NAD(P)-dependent oxidoreductase [Roseomonas sp. E05]MDJ0387687.1 NAD(P)-dependent oxidoreductase [Roseomonas sp. E05]